MNSDDDTQKKVVVNQARVQGLEEAATIIECLAGDWPDKAAHDAGFLVDQIRERAEEIRQSNFTLPYFRDPPERRFPKLKNSLKNRGRRV